MNDRVLLIAGDDQTLQAVRQACAHVGAELLHASALSDVRVLEERIGAVIATANDFDAVVQRLPQTPVLVLGDAADSEASIRAIKGGALDYLGRPLDSSGLASQIRSALRVSEGSHRPATYEDTAKPARDDVDRIIGQSPAMQDVYKAIGRIAPQQINVLITGESGTGKELVARALLHHSDRRDRPYLAVNCAAIPDTLLESELFGHEKGAFTGADERRLGKFEQCHRGTLFLDEIGDIPLATQAKLLRVLQDQTFQRLGGSETIRCDVRIIAATHQPLEQLIDERRFRADLYYRLNVATIHVPPLREREVDVVLLAHYFVEKYNSDFGTQVRAFSPETLPLLLNHSWPGNVRELENAIRATLVMARGSVLHPEFLPEWVRASSSPAAARPAVEPSEAAHADDQPRSLEACVASAAEWALVPGIQSGESLFHRAIEYLEAAMIRAALREHRGKIAPAAAHLGISRTTLRRKMAAYGIDITTT